MPQIVEKYSKLVLVLLIGIFLFNYRYFHTHYGNFVISHSDYDINISNYYIDFDGNVEIETPDKGIVVTPPPYVITEDTVKHPVDEISVLSDFH